VREALVGLVLALAAATAIAGSPAEAVTQAWADVQQLPDDVRSHVGYLSVHAIPEARRAAFFKTLNFHVNCLSREGDFATPLKVGDDVYRIDRREFGWDDAVWEKLPDPYFLDLQNPQQEVRRHFDGKSYKVTRTEKVTFFPMGGWCGPHAAELANATQSHVPIVRADWYIAQTARQVNTEGAGYYDFLGIKSREDIEDLCGLDTAKARKLAREIAAIVEKSGVAQNNRQILRFQSITGGYWASLDTAKSTGKNNALRLLDGDFKHDAEEIYFTLPNGLFGLAASTDKGVLQDTVPDTIATDKESTSNDGRIHPSLSCIRCHTNGLKPIKDWAREFYSGGTSLQGPDFDKHKDLKRLYLGELDSKITRDVDDYAAALERLNGRTPKEQSEAYAEAWRAYSEDDVGGEQFAAELGYSKIELLRALFNYAQAHKVDGLDPIPRGLLKIPEIPMRREHAEEIFGTVAMILKGTHRDSK
jgi:hypothetical protein